MVEESKHVRKSWINTLEQPERLVGVDNGSLMSDGLEASHSQRNQVHHSIGSGSDGQLSFHEQAFSAAGAAVLSAILVNPLDVVKTRLQAQAAGGPYTHPLSNSILRMAFFGPNMMFADLRCSPSCARAGVHGTVSICPPDCFQYKGTLDVFYKIIRQEGFTRLWRGTNAGLALAIPTVGIYFPFYDVFHNQLDEFATQNAPSLKPFAPALAGSLARFLACTSCYPIELAKTRMQAFKDMHSGKKPPGVLKTLIEVISNVRRTTNVSSLQSYRVLWSGLTAQLARDVPFSAILWPIIEQVRSPLLKLMGDNCLQSYRVLWSGLTAQLARDVPFSAILWPIIEQVRSPLLKLMGDNTNTVGILGANFSAGFVAGSIAAAATCPFDVAKTRRQIEKDPTRAMRMTTRKTLVEVWRSGGLRGLFTGVGPRIGRAGPSVGIVVSFYEVMKHVLHHQYATK